MVYKILPSSIPFSAQPCEANYTERKTSKIFIKSGHSNLNVLVLVQLSNHYTTLTLIVRTVEQQSPCLWTFPVPVFL